MWGFKKIHVDLQGRIALFPVWSQYGLFVIDDGPMGSGYVVLDPESFYQAP
jgi:hypothetical protein